MAAPSTYQSLPQQDQLAAGERASLLGRPQSGLGSSERLAEPYAALAKEGEFSTGLFDFCGQPGGTGTCCLSAWLPCVQYGLIVGQLPPVSSFRSLFSTEPDGVICGGRKWGGCLTFFVLSGIHGVLMTAHLAAAGIVCCRLATSCAGLALLLQLRAGVRSKYGIKRNPVNDQIEDILSVVFCASCSLCQMAREVTIRQAAERTEQYRANSVPTPPVQQVLVYSVPGPMGYAQPADSVYGGMMPTAPATGIPVLLPGKHD